MLYAHKVTAALEAKRAGFDSGEDSFAAALAAYRAALGDLAATYPQRTHLEERLAGAGMGSGARPTERYDAWVARAAAGTLPILPLGRGFAHHADARDWAEVAISRATTAAVDGSQLLPWRDASIPVALVQAGIFVNPHDAARPYIKDVQVEVLGPDDFAPPDDVLDDDKTHHLAADEQVNLRRFELETRVLVEWMRGWHATADQPAPVAFLDGSLIVSFATTMPKVMRDRYVAAATELLATSAAARVPLVAYIDTSFARDMVGMLRAAFPERALPPTKRVHDGLLWGDHLAWGDATVPWISARGDVLADYGAQRGGIAFAYLQAATDRPPARIEMPRWVAESDLFPHVLDVLRAELVAGNGYPYAIETADAVAVIGLEDRARFYALFQRFAEEAGLPLTFSRKSVSKSRRR